jgi:hypothetical protein
MTQLLSSFGKQGVRLGLDIIAANIDDTTYLSKYFAIVEYNPVFTAGKNPFSFNGSNLLAKNSEIKVECLDSKGNPQYIEFYKSTIQNTDITKFVISINIYNETYNGPGKLILVGTTVDGKIVRWIGNIAIDKTLSNESKVRFYTNPSLEIRPLLYPVVDVKKAQTIVPPNPPAKTAQATATILSKVGTVIITEGGADYTSAPTVDFVGGGYTTKAHGIASITDGRVTSIFISVPGSGYTTSPTINLIGGGYSTIAQATAVLSSKVISGDVTFGGGGYDPLNPPVITFLPIGPGHGANATAFVADNGEVSFLTIDNGGEEYVYPPTITFPKPFSEAIDLNKNIQFNEKFYSYAVTPEKDFNKNYIDKKRIDIDYRLVIPYILDRFADPSLLPTGSFNTQMEGKSIVLYISKIATPKSYREQTVNITQSFTIKKVIDSKTIILNEPFYYQIGKDYLITNIIDGTCIINYSFNKYNTSLEANLETDPFDGSTPQPILQSYAEVTYRNLRPFSGYVARHKLYRKSLSHPGDYQLLSDEPLSTVELLTDIITVNKAYDKMGYFYNQEMIDKYWYPTSGLTITSKTTPINSVYIYGGSPSEINGSDYVIAKTDSVQISGNDPEIINDNRYYEYDENSFNNLNGQSYNSNFISLKKDVLYVLSMKAILEKNINDITANVSFYFTSSINDIRKETTYNPYFGMKLGEISTKDKVEIKTFNGVQQIFFTPSADYYGTLIIVPTRCNITLSELSLKIYEDYGFSPDILFIRIPFPINVKNELFDIKAELFDINSNIIYSSLRTVQTFDVDGVSDTVIGEGTNISAGIQVYQSANQTQVIMSPQSVVYMPGEITILDLIPTQDKPQRFVGWFTPSNDPETSGKLCYTNVSKLFIESDDYISLSTVDGNVETTVTSLAVKYLGRRIFIDTAGNKYHYS